MLKGRSLLLIGGSKGIGAAIAQRAKSEGAYVTIASRSQPTFGHDLWLAYDARESDTTALSALPGTIDALVYMPGSIQLKPFNRFSDADFEADFQLNVLGAVRAVRAVLPQLKSSDAASVLFFSTVAARLGMPFHSSIASSKAALEGLARSLAAEYAASRIRFNVLSPSLTQSELAANLLASPEKQEAANKRHPLGRYGQPADFAGIACQLLSPESSWISGQTLGVDGGLSCLKV